MGNNLTFIQVNTQVLGSPADSYSAGRRRRSDVSAAAAVQSLLDPPFSTQIIAVWLYRASAYVRRRWGTVH
jgi:hypothetical protein